MRILHMYKMHKMHNDHMDPPISAFQLPAENLPTQSIPLPTSLVNVPLDTLSTAHRHASMWPSPETWANYERPRHQIKMTVSQFKITE